MNPSGYVFLAEAFHEIGHARFGAAWTGFEPYLPVDRASEAPSVIDILKKNKENWTDAEREVVQKANEEHMARKTDPDGYQARMREREAERERERAEQERDRCSSEARASVIQNEIIRRCEAGELVSAFRPVRGGAMQNIPSHLWNGATAIRFHHCQMSLTDPFGSGFAGAGFGYIFIERASLDRFLLSQPFAEKPVGLDIHLSPYLQVLVTVARKMQITPENQPKKEAIVEEIKAAWTGPPELLLNTLVGYMATILREPESQLGRAAKKKA